MSYGINLHLRHIPFSNSATYNIGIEQITKADRDACHALRRDGKARATLRRLSSTVLRIIGSHISMDEILNSHQIQSL